jgi:hypothetical protein
MTLDGWMTSYATRPQTRREQLDVLRQEFDLLCHEADLSIAAHHTYGGGVSDHIRPSRTYSVFTSRRALAI